MSNIVDGRAIARKIIENLKLKPRPIKELAVFLVGNDPSSISFIKKKEKIANELGVSFRLYKHSAEEGEEEALKSFSNLASSNSIGGIVFQLPLPNGFDRDRFLEILPPEKDVDNLTGESKVLEPVTLTVQAVLEETNTKVHDMTVAIIGKGFLVGAPIIRWIEPRCKHILVLDKTSGLHNIHEAGLVISGTGEAGLIDPAILKKDAAVIDFGYGVDKTGRFSGDLDMSSRDFERLSWYTPTPGGTGPILVAKLFENFYALNHNPNNANNYPNDTNNSKHSDGNSGHSDYDS
jgi:methylenetetrahydrofolate dehydrogenase (NADP+) / methenyltetrahydrofolate cyclohydrolase